MQMRLFGEERGVAEFLLGINYWPRRSAMYMWERFDLGELREDFARIHELRLRVVRFFLLWETFQPEPDRIDAQMLRRFDAVMDALAEANLYAMPSLFTGHMSGVNFVPAWALDRSQTELRFRTFSGGSDVPFGCGNFYSGDILAAQILQARTIGERTRNHPALFMWDLGNEFSNLRAPNSPREATDWCKQLVTALLETSDAGVTAGNHGEDLTQDRHFGFGPFANRWFARSCTAIPFTPHSRAAGSIRMSSRSYAK